MCEEDGVPLEGGLVKEDLNPPEKLCLPACSEFETTLEGMIFKAQTCSPIENSLQFTRRILDATILEMSSWGGLDGSIWFGRRDLIR